MLEKYFWLFNKNCTCKDFRNDYDYVQLKFLVKEGFDVKDGNERRLVSAQCAGDTMSRSSLSCFCGGLPDAHRPQLAWRPGNRLHVS